MLRYGARGLIDSLDTAEDPASPMYVNKHNAWHTSLLRRFYHSNTYCMLAYALYEYACHMHAAISKPCAIVVSVEVPLKRSYSSVRVFLADSSFRARISARDCVDGSPKPLLRAK